ncbi:hypothetical protein DPEC_G00124970 [Dallia pectoralis]|uniref:Uncharacterized protein n=1 Tax=Dallia pectoralis TaxID=75939 RepID=A0ACC2GR62_DALPE|nr:hypothetical protein DPEC_G00124970 [Dallia pectoralis]
MTKGTPRSQDTIQQTIWNAGSKDSQNTRRLNLKATFYVSFRGLSVCRLLDPRARSLADVPEDTTKEYL